jgi:DegV family protein with EDD domain
MRANGATIEEAHKWIEENKLNIHQDCCVADLKYLKQAGRVSAGSAFFGGLFQVKPIIISDAKGQNFAIEKVKGRKQSIDRIVERMKADYRPDEAFPDVIVSHADCIEDAEYLKSQVIEKVGVKEEDITMNFIGPIIGATTGPGTMSLYFYGTEVTENKE